MVEARQKLNLSALPLQVFTVGKVAAKHLDCNGAAKRFVVREVDGCHAAAAKPGLEAEPSAENCAD